jgi:hypothetical protein
MEKWWKEGRRGKEEGIEQKERRRVLMGIALVS